MSLGDELRFLRAMKGGMSTQDIAETIGLGKVRTLNEIEQRYRMVGDEETISKLSAYFGVPAERLMWHRGRYRKALSAYLQNAMDSGELARFELRTGETLRGRVIWWDLGAFSLQVAEGNQPLIVQRHVVIDWEDSQSLEVPGSYEDEEADTDLVEQ